MLRHDPPNSVLQLGFPCNLPTIVRQAASKGQKDRYDLYTVQQLLRHAIGETTMAYTHVLSKGNRGVRRPLD